jgi:hypothetical protein
MEPNQIFAQEGNEMKYFTHAYIYLNRWKIKLIASLFFIFLKLFSFSKQVLNDQFVFIRLLEDHLFFTIRSMLLFIVKVLKPQANVQSLLKGMAQ